MDKNKKRTHDRRTNDVIRRRDLETAKRYRQTEKGKEAKKRGDAAYRERNRERIRKNARDWKLKKLYGITREEFDTIIKMQGGRCPVCENEIDLEKYQYAVDHCHDSGKLRGVICKQCNRGLGLLGDNEEGVRRALKYLQDPPILKQLAEIRCEEAQA